MPAVMVDIAEAVKDELNGGSFSQSFTAERRYLPLFDLKDLTTLRVSVVGKALDLTAANRAKHWHDCRIDIGVQKKVTGTEPADLDPYLLLMQEILDHFRSRSSLGGFSFLKAENDPLYWPKHLHEEHVFTSVATLTYRVLR